MTNQVRRVSLFKKEIPELPYVVRNTHESMTNIAFLIVRLCNELCPLMLHFSQTLAADGSS